MARKLILIRHEEVESRFAGKLIGSTDAGLSPDGLKKAERLSKLLSTHRPNLCFSSPKRRCLDTAYQATAGLGVDVIVDDELREADFGTWEGLSFAEISTHAPQLVAKWARFEPGFAFPGGDRLSAFIGRVCSASDRLARLEADSAAVFTHGGVIRFMLCHLLGLDLRHYVIFDVKHGGVFFLVIDKGKAMLESLVSGEGL